MTKKPEKDINDAELLKQVFRDVTPLPGRTLNRTVSTRTTPEVTKTPGPRVKHLPSIPSQPDPHLPEIRHGEAPGLDKRSAQKLKRGQMEIEARLDLHGLRQEEAYRALTSLASDT